MEDDGRQETLTVIHDNNKISVEKEGDKKRTDENLSSSSTNDLLNITTNNTINNDNNQEQLMNMKKVEDDTESEDEFDILDESHVWFAQLMHRIDSVGDGKISFQQFCVFCTMLKKQWDLQAATLKQNTTNSSDSLSPSSSFGKIFSPSKKTYVEPTSVDFTDLNHQNHNRAMIVERNCDLGEQVFEKDGKINNQASSIIENNLAEEGHDVPFIISPTRITEKELQEQLYDSVFSHVTTPRKNI